MAHGITIRVHQLGSWLLPQWQVCVATNWFNVNLASFPRLLTVWHTADEMRTHDCHQDHDKGPSLDVHGA